MTGGLGAHCLALGNNISNGFHVMRCASYPHSHPIPFVCMHAYHPPSCAVAPLHGTTVHRFINPFANRARPWWLVAKEPPC